MEPIFPLQEEVVNRYCGYPVCVVMNDGSRHVGILSSCSGGKVLLNAEAGSVEANVTQMQPKASKKKKSGKGKTESAYKSGQPHAQTQSYPYDPSYVGPEPYYPWGRALALDFALVAFLFLLL